VVGGRATAWMVGLVLLGCVLPPAAYPRWRRPIVRAVPPAPSPSIPLPWPHAEILGLALRAYDCARSARLVAGRLLTVIDYTLPSTARRLWVIDVTAGRVLLNELVAHGSGSGENYAAAFSNEPGSRQSSLGLFRTEDTYLGEHGESLRLSGLEPGINDRAMARAIVMHGAPYVSSAVIAARGQLGRSWGCLALEPGVDRRVIEQIKGGTALFAYYPDPRWLERSRFLRCDDAAVREAAADAAAGPGVAPGTAARTARAEVGRRRSRRPTSDRIVDGAPDQAS